MADSILRSVRETHDAVFLMLDTLSEEQQATSDLRSAVLQLFLVDSEVLRNLFELYTGESPDPEMLHRDDHAEWFKRSNQRMGHLALTEVLNRARQVRIDLLDQLSQPLPPFLEENDQRILALVQFSIKTAKEVSDFLAQCLPPRP